MGNKGVQMVVQEEEETNEGSETFWRVVKIDFPYSLSFGIFVLSTKEYYLVLGKEIALEQLSNTPQEKLQLSNPVYNNKRLC